ncbi:hypothetical protein [Pseudomonas putida]|uniref:hypothetical protein n=1 Tax=Pseudomonas putida TaxID=303 RepID=UPI0009A200ED|nr:hypothetical protein [Pseudomonas putida]
MEADKFRKAIDGDEGFKKKRANLFYLSLLLLAIVVSGADIKEASSLIFKIEFTNHENLQWLLVAGVIYSMLRYYAYSEVYRDELFKRWSDKMLSNPSIYYLDHEIHEVTGHIGEAINIYGGDEPGLAAPEYLKTGILQRKIAYPSKENHSFYGECDITRYVDLNTYSKKWTRKDFMLLLWFETKYRVNAWVSHRETLDLVAPYLMAVGALAIFFCKKVSLECGVPTLRG